MCTVDISRSSPTRSSYLVTGSYGPFFGGGSFVFHGLNYGTSSDRGEGIKGSDTSGFPLCQEISISTFTVIFLYILGTLCTVPFPYVYFPSSLLYQEEYVDNWICVGLFGSGLKDLVFVFVFFGQPSKRRTRSVFIFLLMSLLTTVSKEEDVSARYLYMPLLTYSNRDNDRGAMSYPLPFVRTSPIRGMGSVRRFTVHRLVLCLHGLRCWYKELDRYNSVSSRRDHSLVVVRMIPM